jgi:hypothetical protein
LVELDTARIVGWANEWKIVKLPKDEASGDGAAEKSEILKSCRESIELGDGGSRAEDGGDVEEKAAKPGKSLRGPDRGMLRDVFVGGGHIWFNEEGMRACAPEPITETAGGRHSSAWKSEFVKEVVVGGAGWC